MARHAQAKAAPAPAHEAPTLADVLDSLPIDAEVADDIAKKGSVVRTGYKQAYAARAAEAGLGKTAQRSCWDWLAQQLAGEVLVETKFVESKFRALLDANGVRHEHWQNKSKGWEGRLRMTGRLALQKVVAKNGVLRTADGEELVPPAEWIAKHTH